MTGRDDPCADRTMALHALIDGELDTLATVALEEHLRNCPGCRSELERFEHLRAMLADPALRHAVPAGLRSRVLAAIDAPALPARLPLRRAAPWLGGGAIGALMAGLLLVLAVPEVTEPGLADGLVDGQIRSLQGGHLVDVVTSDRHTVKPWFNGRIPYAPPVVDLAAQGFALVGGRLDVVEHQNVAVLVYRRRLHTINLFIRPLPDLASSLAAHRARSGYNLLRWTGGGLEFWAVSDINSAELGTFRQVFSHEAGAS